MQIEGCLFRFELLFRDLFGNGGFFAIDLALDGFDLDFELRGSTADWASERSLLSCSTVIRACATHWSSEACAESNAASFCASCCLAWLESKRMIGRHPGDAQSGSHGRVELRGVPRLEFSTAAHDHQKLALLYDSDRRIVG